MQSKDEKTIRIHGVHGIHAVCDTCGDIGAAKVDGMGGLKLCEECSADLAPTVRRRLPPRDLDTDPSELRIKGAQ